jgi:PHD/YefM family antitoxin component YafN of YafNO toxin-antitoxin module
MKKVTNEPEIITRAGKAVSVILPLKDYQKLLDRLEDAEDTACLKMARSKPLSFRPLKEYLAERNKARV